MSGAGRARTPMSPVSFGRRDSARSAAHPSSSSFPGRPRFFSAPRAHSRHGWQSRSWNGEWRSRRVANWCKVRARGWARVVRPITTNSSAVAAGCWENCVGLASRHGRIEFPASLHFDVYFWAFPIPLGKRRATRRVSNYGEGRRSVNGVSLFTPEINYYEEARHAGEDRRNCCAPRVGIPNQSESSHCLDRVCNRFAAGIDFPPRRVARYARHCVYQFL